jgi:hypothetical protein
MMFLKKAIQHFLEFHKGNVNIILHVIGFVGIFYSIWKLNWIMFAVSFVVVEAGHVYNHFVGLKKYDFRAEVIFWRILVFVLLLLSFYLLIQLLG